MTVVTKLLAGLVGVGIVVAAMAGTHSAEPDRGLSESQLDLLADVRSEVPTLDGKSDERIVAHTALVCEKLALPRRNRYEIALSALRSLGYRESDAETFVLYAAGISCPESLPRIPR
ncbi:hypothetical protein [Rhodococcus sp. NPDC127528]|uniref:hypothetical protein n=1 Tax=unclassified Rhodococcus (in: high G+C Gram-positive bacteria) TaxID=192944 RepID=UPI00362D52E3